MEHTDSVSIITPSYNSARFVRATIDSVIAQTHPQWEMLLVDDCSSDGSPELIEEISRREPRVRLIRQPRNAGPACARNAALEAARNAKVAFLDSDDVWLPNKLERQLHFMRSNGYGFSYTNFRRMDEFGGQIGLTRELPLSLSYHQYLKNTAVVTSTVLIDRAVVGDFRMPNATKCDDFAAWLEIMRRGHVAYGLQEDLLRYRVVSSSISRNKARWAMGIWKTYREVERLSLPYAMWCFSHYALRGYMKYRSL
jgi:teichuronic acid biosynthesis glycosyltransferase TuaG